MPKNGDAQTCIKDAKCKKIPKNAKYKMQKMQKDAGKKMQKD